MRIASKKSERLKRSVIEIVIEIIAAIVIEIVIAVIRQGIVKRKIAEKIKGITVTRVTITRVVVIATRNRLERKGIIDIVRRMAKMNAKIRKVVVQKITE